MPGSCLVATANAWIMSSSVLLWGSIAESFGVQWICFDKELAWLGHLAAARFYVVSLNRQALKDPSSNGERGLTTEVGLG